MKKKPKTEGLEWLQHSIAAFNGSGYADYDSAEAYLESYIDYNIWKKRPQAVKLAKEFYTPALALAEHLVADSSGPGRLPSVKNYDKFRLSRNTKLV